MRETVTLWLRRESNPPKKSARPKHSAESSHRPTKGVTQAPFAVA